MISLVFPRIGEDRYFEYTYGLFGPYDTLFKSEGDLIPFRSKLEAIDQKKGIYRENDVLHSSLSGDFSYHPLIDGISLAPTSTYPRRILYHGFDYRGSAISRYANYGLAVHKTSSMSVSTTQVIQVAWTKIDETKWSFRLVTVSLNSPTAVSSFQDITFWLTSQSANSNLVYTVEQYSNSNNGGLIETGSDWRVQQSWDTIFGLTTPLMSHGSRTNFGNIFKADKSPVLSPTKAREKIDSLVAQIFPEKFPIDDVHYGDLAMQASDRYSALNINSIAFLRDLRRPWELIPKLSRLKSLKGLSDQFLSVKYGILPTISDVNSIIGAFRQRKPYYDPNGFNVKTAGVTKTLVKDQVLYTLVQRIKLAVSDEDELFDDLITRLDNWGSLPTFEVIWDLIPYSFVVDWLVDVGGFLERVDSNLRLLRLNIRYVTMSRKTTVSGTFPERPGAPLVGSVNWVHYHRWVSDQCPVPPLSLQTTFQVANHWLESGALIVQRTKR